MRLELDILNVREVRFGKRTGMRGGVLQVNAEELLDLIKEERFEDVALDLAHPGESCRIVQVFDLTEPRAKLGAGENFPGILGKLQTVGEGRTRVLRGVAVAAIDYTAGPRGTLIDMSGPGAALDIYSKLAHVVLMCRPSKGIARTDYQHALRLAGLKAAVYLAEATRNRKGDETEVYDLPAPSEASKGLEGLPKVAYIYQIHSHQFPTRLAEPILYGDNVKKLIPTILHPNEVFDGAVVRGYWGRGQETYSIQNHPVVKELYAKHGKELCFVGVVITVAQSTEPERERSAAMASNLVRWVLGADGAVLTKIGGGAPHIDLAQTCERLEGLGVKTSLIVQDMSFDGMRDGALIFNTPKANAIVNIGSYGAPVTLSPMERVIGGPVIFPGNIPAEGALRVQAMNLGGAMSQIGGSYMVAHEY